MKSSSMKLKTRQLSETTKLFIESCSGTHTSAVTKLKLRSWRLLNFPLIMFIRSQTSALFGRTWPIICGTETQSLLMILTRSGRTTLTSRRKWSRMDSILLLKSPQLSTLTKTESLSLTRPVKKLLVVSSATANLSFRWLHGELTLTLTVKSLATSSKWLSDKRNSSATKEMAYLMNGFKNSGTGWSVTRMTRKKPHSHKLDQSLTATLNSNRNGRQHMTNSKRIIPPALLMEDITLGLDQNQSNCITLFRLSSLVPTIRISKITWILTKTMVLLCMSYACIVNSLQCFASALSLVSSSDKILILTM